MLASELQENSSKKIPVKCLVWDLDHTLWDGVLLESKSVCLREGVADALRLLDERGILHSIASKNDPASAMAWLKKLGVEEYFLYPQIGWGPKSDSVKAVAEALNIGLDAVAFIDDQEFERDEVAYHFPEVRSFCASRAAELPSMNEFRPRFVTEDSRKRRAMYLADGKRKLAEASFEGPQESFLATLEMRLTLETARESDLARAEELTVRTHQLNTTGRQYSHEVLDAFRKSPDHLLMIARLTDRYGDCGVIGLALVEMDGNAWILRLLLMSCRVMSRGVGGVFLNYFRRIADEAGIALYADFAPTDRNRMMYVTFRFAGFRESEWKGEPLLKCESEAIPPTPRYLDFSAPERLALPSMAASKSGRTERIKGKGMKR